MGILKKFLRHIFLAAISISLLIVSTGVRGQETQLVEQQIRAGLFYNFLKYTTWPAAAFEATGDLRVCLFGDDDFNSYLSPLEGRTAQKLEISITVIDQVENTGRCHIVFIPGNRLDDAYELLTYLQSKPVLTVSDSKRFTEIGGMVELVKEDNFVKINISRTAIRGSELKIQDRLLKLAESDD